MVEPGRSFGAEAAAYERGRPEWPEELLDPLPLGADAEVLDLGAGTGKLTRVLARRYARVVAVEPDERLRALIRVGEPVAGAAEAVPVPDGSVDGAFAAESFHWFDPERAVPEIARALRPGGIVALVFNHFHTYDALPEEFRSGGSTNKLLRGEEWRDLFAGGLFDEFRTAEVEQEREQPREELLAYFASTSRVTAMPDAERSEWLRRLGEALDRPSYRRTWTATMHWACRR